MLKLARRSSSIESQALRERLCTGDTRIFAVKGTSPDSSEWTECRDGIRHCWKELLMFEKVPVLAHCLTLLQGLRGEMFTPISSSSRQSRPLLVGQISVGHGGRNVMEPPQWRCSKLCRRLCRSSHCCRYPWCKALLATLAA